MLYNYFINFYILTSINNITKGILIIMKIKIDYGKKGIYVNLPSNSTVLRPLVTNPLKKSI